MLIDDRHESICPDQVERWIEIRPFLPPYPMSEHERSDFELERVLHVLADEWGLARPGFSSWDYLRHPAVGRAPTNTRPAGGSTVELQRTKSDHAAAGPLFDMVATALPDGEIRMLIERNDTPPALLAAAVDQVLSGIRIPPHSALGKIDGAWVWLGRALDRILEETGERCTSVAVVLGRYERMLPMDLLASWRSAVGRISMSETGWGATDPRDIPAPTLFPCSPWPSWPPQIQTADTMKKLLILDLDETLIHASEEPLDRPADFRVLDLFHVYQRPHLGEFLHDVFGDWHVAVWTTSTGDYAQAIVDRIMPAGAHLVSLYARDQCTRRFDPETSEQFFIKNLRKMTRDRYRPENVIAVDDTPRNWMLSYGNLIRVTPWEGDPDDDELKLLGRYLSRIRQAPDYRRIEKRGWRQAVQEKRES